MTLEIVDTWAASVGLSRADWLAEMAYFLERNAHSVEARSA
jgi:hypothetical protein